MKAYLKDFKATIGQKQQMPWICVDTAHRKCYEDATHVYVPRQHGTNDDCGVYICIFADLISQRRRICEAEERWISRAREQLQKIIDLKAISSNDA